MVVKPIVGGAVAGFMAGIVALAAAGLVRGSHASAAAPMGMLDSASALPAVPCGTHEQAVIERVLVNGRDASILRCAPRVDDRFVYYPPQPYAQPYAAPAAYAPQAVYSSPAPAARPAVQRRTVSAPAAERVVYVDREDDVRPGRSWGKTALILGGSAGTGAGIGAIAGGKKGALIGAAIGGGAASIYEATKR
jgi:hypothetical protein